jgi:hypothetical protein
MHKLRKLDNWFYPVLALVGGLFAGWVDFNNDEPQAAVIVILLCTALLGFARPRKSWIWALIVALCLPLVYLLARAAGLRPVGWPEPGIYASLLALIPAFIGAYGVALLRMVSTLLSSSPGETR